MAKSKRVRPSFAENRVSPLTQEKAVALYQAACATLGREPMIGDWTTDTNTCGAWDLWDDAGMRCLASVDVNQTIYKNHLADVTTRITVSFEDQVRVGK